MNIAPVSRNKILIALGYEKAVTNPDVELLPSDIRYKDNEESSHILLGTLPVFTLTPRLTFFRAINMFDGPHENKHYVDITGVCIGIGENVVIGDEGFGYAKQEDGSWLHIKHFGRVVIGENVIIHNNTNIDRGVTGETVIGDGCVIDSLVHIAHGARLGKNVAVAAGAVICGSVEIGDNVFVGAGSTILQKLKIGSGVTIGGGAVVTKDVMENDTVYGNPAKSNQIKTGGF